MILDIAIATVVILAMASGFRAGFIYTFLHTAGWLLSIVLAFVWSPWAKKLLVEKTGFYDLLQSAFLERLSDYQYGTQLVDTFPEMLQSAIRSMIGQATAYAASSVADMIVSIVSFLLVVFAIKLIFWLLINFLSKRNNDGMRGFFDGLLGTVVGFAKGIILVFILLAVMIPVASMFDPKWAVFVTDWMASSYFAATLYDNNLIVLIIQDLIGA